MRHAYVIQCVCFLVAGNGESISMKNVLLICFEVYIVLEISACKKVQIILRAFYF